MNKWMFSGELIRLKEFQGEFSYSLKIRGIARRLNSCSTQVAEMVCLVPSALRSDIVFYDVKLYSPVSVSGHIETWEKENSRKTMFVVDKINR